MAQTVKNLPAMWETWLQSLDWEDPLEEGMASHFSIPAWKIPMDRGAWWATAHGVTESDRTERLSTVRLFVTPWTVACKAPLSMESLQARILEWVAISSSRGSSQSKDRTQVSHVAGGFFTVWATREAHWSSLENVYFMLQSTLFFHHTVGSYLTGVKLMPPS